MDSFPAKALEEAKIYIEQAIRNDSTLSNVVKEHAGDIYAQTGDIERKLLSFWRKALEGNKENATLRKKIELKENT